MKDIYEVMNDLLCSREDFVLATILEKSGSAPREQGTKMIIKRDLSIEGTIGGGILEAMAIKMSADIFKNKRFVIREFTLSNEGASAIGAACGGSLKLLLEYINPDDEAMNFIYKKSFELKNKGDNFVFITRLDEKENYVTGIDKWICTETGFYGQENDMTQKILRKVRKNFKNIHFHNVREDDRLYLVEPVLNSESVYIMGAGHVSQKIAVVAKMLNFKTIVLDDREEFANRENFKTADEVKVIQSFEDISHCVKIDNRSYIIIVTRGHGYDKEVLAQVLKTDAKYIGMIGSKTKRDFVYKRLMDEGYTAEDLKRVHCPIGISIGAQTPEEIAVSITAEMIKVRRES
ncbi:XdhC family aldehyde oxidoreductase maturation factor [Clostridium sp. MT-14]|uniref:XdhC family protein n=1 Tax=Clostridium aromativorans TaxID=2836848 RepID=A0ABS8N6V7_9CLOT|nr:MULTISPECIES: XdhC/CoxI family protein [Clostridium]KAA8678816.1 XdhC family protein [Clostridium sp. HV4-5-A1G]MCC9295556.1 XdhC family protein [Clostridium aromativorans]CAB1245940.1 Xanthine and CO dehydrogenases maturation factor, XdhC/CoxF family [Clostridiaceae bacterium BL-3]